jgi:hypothetical protein
VIEALPPTTAASTFKAAGKTVTTSASTVFAGGAVKTFADLKLKMRVEIKGSLTGDTFTATRVEVQEAAAPAPKPEPAEAELSGTISALSGTASSFQFTIGSRLVKGDGSTKIVGSSNAAKAFADLKNGGTVEVKGVQHDGFVLASRIKIEGPEKESDGEEAEVEGTLGALSGKCPAIGSSVAGTAFTTSAATAFERAACVAFKSGDTVQVKGAKKTDGSIAATRLRKK